MTSRGLFWQPDELDSQTWLCRHPPHRRTPQHEDGPQGLLVLRVTSNPIFGLPHAPLHAVIIMPKREWLNIWCAALARVAASLGRAFQKSIVQVMASAWVDASCCTAGSQTPPSPPRIARRVSRTSFCAVSLYFCVHCTWYSVGNTVMCHTNTVARKMPMAMPYRVAVHTSCRHCYTAPLHSWIRVRTDEHCRSSRVSRSSALVPLSTQRELCTGAGPGQGSNATWSRE